MQWSREELQRRDLAIRQLMKSEGWELFIQMLDSEEAVALQKLMGANDPHWLAQATGALRVIKGFKTWPVQALDTIKRYLAEDQYMP
jgi:hypothetical protein